jgi:UDP-4-amino-4,6-dideoxy-N-acetyl-beta-L-altrosamine N-acetyltransferase
MPCELRLVTETDLSRILHWRTMPEITRFMYTDPVLTPETQARWFLAVTNSQTDMVWVIWLDTGEPVGLISLSDISIQHHRCSWAYYLAEASAQGKGLGKSLECNIADFVFFELGLDKLWCEVLSFNDRVVRLHERFGSKIEGVLRRHIRKNGEYYDVVRMGLLKEEWEKRRLALHYEHISIEKKKLQGLLE